MQFSTWRGRWASFSDLGDGTVSLGDETVDCQQILHFPMTTRGMMGISSPQGDAICHLGFYRIFILNKNYLSMGLQKQFHGFAIVFEWKAIICQQTFCPFVPQRRFLGVICSVQTVSQCLLFFRRDLSWQSATVKPFQILFAQIF